MFHIAPLKDVEINFPWEGDCTLKPWDYKVTVAIPFLGTLDTLKLCLECIKLQSIKSYIIIIDTGSDKSTCKKLETLRKENIEIHYLKLHGVLHPSDFATHAMNLAFNICRTEQIFSTHADCFLRNRYFIENLSNQCNKKNPVIGYQMTPRQHTDWQWMVSHTATIYDMTVMDDIGFDWNQRRLCRSFGIKHHKPDIERPSWPDADYLGNYILRKNNIKPTLIGKEDNFCRNKDENIDHVRGVMSGRQYVSEYYEHIRGDLKTAKKEALERIKRWNDGV